MSLDPAMHERCPDGGYCHHACPEPCWRTHTCGPLSGVFDGDWWPECGAHCPGNLRTCERGVLPHAEHRAELSPGTYLYWFDVERGPVRYRVGKVIDPEVEYAPGSLATRSHAW